MKVAIYARVSTRDKGQDVKNQLAAGTPLGVQKDLMRHAAIATTTNIYGGGVAAAMREFNSQVVRDHSVAIPRFLLVQPLLQP